MDLLQQIIELDKAASSRIDVICEAENRKLKKSYQKAEQEQAHMIETRRADAETLRAERQEQLARKREESADSLAQSKARLDEIFATHNDEWQNEIMDRITGVERE